MDRHLDDSVAFTVLSELLTAGILSELEVEYLQEIYSTNQKKLSVLKQSESDLQRKCNICSDDIMNQKLQHEKLKIEEMEEMRQLKKLEEHKSTILREVEQSEQQEMICKYELSALQRIHEEMMTELDNLNTKNESLVQPVITSLKQQISDLESNLLVADESLHKESSKSREFNDTVSDLHKILKEKSEVLYSKIESLKIYQDSTSSGSTSASASASTPLLLDTTKAATPSFMDSNGKDNRKGIDHDGKASVVGSSSGGNNSNNNVSNMTNSRRIDSIDSFALDAFFKTKVVYSTPKLCEALEKAIHSLTMEYNILVRKRESLEKELSNQQSVQSETMKLKKKLTEKLELNRKTLQGREQDVNVILNSLDVAKAKLHDIVLVKVELNSKRKELDNDLRHALDEFNFFKKDYEILKRQLKKKRIIVNGVKELIPTLEERKKDLEVRIKQQKADNISILKMSSELKEEVDYNLAKLLAEESMNSDVKESLEKVLIDSDCIETEIAKCLAENKKQKKMISILTAQRDVKGRENSRMINKEREADQHVKIKELTILDLTKRCNEVCNRLKEFSALYEVVKNERNKYVNFIQSSAQALAEMKEKIRILSNEVEILTNESVAKNSALIKEKATHIQAQRQRDSLRQDMNRLLADYRVKQSLVEQQIQEIDKMNVSISKIENEMIDIKSIYEKAIQDRNLTGVQLIDRNDELCIIYEKANHQKHIYQNAERELAKRLNELKTLRLQTEDLRRQYIVVKTKLPEIDKIKNEMKVNESVLYEEKKRSNEISALLEDPHNLERWRPLDGNDYDFDQLSAKMSILENRIDEKRERILQKELELTDITTISDKLKDQAKSRQEVAKRLGDQVNTTQLKVRDVTKRMLATVSELSMYQATALRIQSEKSRREMELEELRWRYTSNGLPTDEIKKEYDLSRTRKANYMTIKSSGSGEISRVKLLESKYSMQFKTSAEPRPTAYIPDDVGIPKPYGNHAPFKPTLTSASRYIKNDHGPKEISI